MKLEAITLEDALRLLSLPRVVGTSSEGRSIESRLGPYGPYVTDGKESRSLASEEEVFTVTQDQALALFAQPKSPMRRSRVREPLKTLGDDPVSKKPIVLKPGKFGFYVTDGVTNATLKQGDMPDLITPERAQELLQLRRDRDAENGGAPAKSGTKPRGRAKPAPRRAAVNGASAKAKTPKAKTTKPKAKRPARAAAKS